MKRGGEKERARNGGKGGVKGRGGDTRREREGDGEAGEKETEKEVKGAFAKATEAGRPGRFGPVGTRWWPAALIAMRGRDVVVVEATQPCMQTRTCLLLLCGPAPLAMGPSWKPRRVFVRSANSFDREGEIFRWMEREGEVFLCKCFVRWICSRDDISRDAFDECVSAVFYFETHSHFGGGRTIAIAFSS